MKYEAINDFTTLILIAPKVDPFLAPAYIEEVEDQIAEIVNPLRLFYTLENILEWSTMDFQNSSHFEQKLRINLRSKLKG